MQNDLYIYFTVIFFIMFLFFIGGLLPLELVCVFGLISIVLTIKAILKPNRIRFRKVKNGK